MGGQHRPPNFLHWEGEAACDERRLKRTGVSIEECAHCRRNAALGVKARLLIAGKSK